MNASPLHHLDMRSGARACPVGALRPGSRRRLRPLSHLRQPKLGFTTDAGLLLIQIKADQTAVFEDLVARLKAGATKSEDATVKQQLTSLKVYKTSEGAPGGHALYVMLLDPVVKGAEYQLFCSSRSS